MSKLDEITESVSKSYSKGKSSIDPLTIIFIAGIILDIIKMIMACYSEEAHDRAAAKINNPSMLDRLILARRIKKFAQSNEADIDLEQLKKSLLEVRVTGKDFTELTLDVDRYRNK